MYVEVSGLRTYYEVHGEGEPVVLLHGGGMTAESWSQRVPALARRYRVFVPERRGHGRTPDSDGPMSYEGMAAETAGFLDELGVGRARVVGWSDGGSVAMHLALSRPDLVAKLVVIGALAGNDGATGGMSDLLSGSEESQALLRMMFQPLYAALSPDGPGHFEVALAKWLSMWQEGPGLAVSDLAKISAPVLVMQGDHDGVRVEHSAEIARTVPDAQLAVLPGTSHSAPLEKPHLVNLILLELLGEQPTTLMFDLR